MIAARHAEAVMGTVVTVEVRAGARRRQLLATESEATAQSAIDQVIAWMHWVDATFSTYKPESEISRLERGDLTTAECHPLVREVLALCDRLRAETGGYFDARAGGHLDPSGVVKGWSVERASTLLAAAGWADHAIDAGGDVRLRGAAGAGRPWQVAIRHPLHLDAFCAVVGLDEGAVATSGTYERGFHVIDPHRGLPATALAAVTVVGPELTVTDAYATAALAMGDDAPGWLAALADHEALVIRTDGTGWATPGFERYRLDRPGAATPTAGGGDRGITSRHDAVGPAPLTR
ncbi:MAG TPA: FAD:protein FMN transferase [Acidimicrobiales bacterium]|nr:FAD:protein FMN transferase [Acidimicrobiales bacterium]